MIADLAPFYNDPTTVRDNIKDILTPLTYGGNYIK